MYFSSRGIGYLFVLILFEGSRMNLAMDNPYYMHQVKLDKMFELLWKFDEKEIQFEILVSSPTGFIGFGFSKVESLSNADIAILKENKGKYSIEDYHTLSNGTLIKDSENNWILLSTEKNKKNSQIKLTFKRNLMTKDRDDIDITRDTLRIVWAHGEGNIYKTEFPVCGFKSLRLLQIRWLNQVDMDDTEKLTIAMNKIPIPNKQTTYLCKDFDVPFYKQKMHIIKISPIVSQGNEMIIHHMLLYSCKKKLKEKKKSQVYGSYDENRPDNWEKCPMVIFGWAIGGSSFPLPKHVGIPLDVTTDPVTFLLEIHYDNPDKKSGLLDSSGFVLNLIPAQRQFDGAIIEVGQIPFDPTSNFIQMIPPYQTNFRSNSVCLSNCLYHAYPVQNEAIIIKVFAVLLHAHLLARQIILHHYRNGIELLNIAADRNYDFNYQEMIYLDKEIPIQPGDDLKIECVYNSMKRRKFTWGGLSTGDEMCLAYVMYYPKIRTTNCLSAIGGHDAQWLENQLNPFNLFQFMNGTVSKKFEQTVNGIETNSSLLTFCSDGINTSLQYQAVKNVYKILHYGTTPTTIPPSRSTEICTESTVVLCKSVLFQASLQLLLLLFGTFVFFTRF